MPVDLKKRPLANTGLGGELKKIKAEVGWDLPKTEKRGFFRVSQPAVEVDMDISAILCVKGKLIDDNDIVYYGNLAHESLAVRHTGKNPPGEDGKEKEYIEVDLTKIGERYDEVVFIVTIYKSTPRKQNFGCIRNAYACMINCENGKEMYSIDLSEQLSGATAAVFAKVKKEAGVWGFFAVANATQDDTVLMLADRFRE